MGARREEVAAGTRSSTRRELVIAQIYAQAAKLFAERGFAGTSLQHVAAATGLTRQALYHYVKSKDELLAQLVTEITRSPTTELRAINRRNDLDCTEKLRAIAQAIATHRATDPHSFLLVVRSEANLPDDLARKHRDGKRAVLDEISKVVEAGVRSGEFRPVDGRITALSLMGMLNWVAWWYNPDSRYSIETAADKVADLAVAVVSQHPELRPDLTDPESAIDAVRADLDILERVIKVNLASNSD